MSISTQVTGFATIKKSEKLDPTTKSKIVQAPAGKERRFIDDLVEVDELLANTPEEMKEAVQAILNNCEVQRLNAKAYIGGHKNGVAVAGRKQSLTSRFAFDLKHVKSVLVDAKAAKSEAKEEELLNDMLDALL